MSERVPGGRRGRDGELWLDPDDVVWSGLGRRRISADSRPASRSGRSIQWQLFPQMPVPSLVGAAGGAVALPGGALSWELRRARRPGWSPERRRRFTHRFLPTAAVAATAAACAPLVLFRPADASRAAEDPPAAPAPVLTTAPSPDSFPVSPGPRFEPAPVSAAGPEPAAPLRQAFPEIAWRRSTAVGVPHAGRLLDGVQLPVSGPGWVTWDPVRDRVPNRALRLYGTDRLVQTLLAVVSAYHATHPDAPPLVIGDLSRRGGGPIDEHVSHENGLDVDVYYPRRDGRLRPPARTSQIDLALAQDLVDRFVAAGAELVLVGRNTHLHGPKGVVLPYPRHDNHLHVRLAAGS